MTEASSGLGPAVLAIASISPLVARTINVGVTTATSADAAMNKVNGGHGATNVRYEKTASAHILPRASIHRFIISESPPSVRMNETPIVAKGRQDYRLGWLAKSPAGMKLSVSVECAWSRPRVVTTPMAV